MSAIAIKERWIERTVPPPALARSAGAVALSTVVFASVCIAAGTAGSRRWLELPTATGPGWLQGPLRGLVPPLSVPGFGVALSVMVVGYLLALACARAIPLRLAVTAIVLATVVFTLGPSLVSTDVFGYIAYAREAAAHGLNPYVSSPSSLPHDAILPFVFWKHEPSPYGPLFTFLSLPLGLVAPAVALWTYKALAGAAAIALALVVARAAQRRGLDPTRAAILVGLNPALLVYAVSGAHNDLLATFLAAAAIALWLTGRDSAAGAAAVAAGAIKATLGLALPFVLVAARRRGPCTRGVLLALAAIGIPAMLVFGGHVFDQLHRIAGQARFDIMFSGPDRLASALGSPIDALVRAVAAGAAAIVAVGMLARALRGADPIAAAGWAFMVLLASIASLAPWYVVWLLPFAALGRSRTLRAATVLATIYVLAVHVPALGGVPWLSAAR